MQRKEYFLNCARKTRKIYRKTIKKVRFSIKPIRKEGKTGEEEPETAPAGNWNYTRV